MAEEKLDEVQKFWKERESRIGGKIEFHTYAALIGECGSGKINGRGGLCYIVGDRVYFEDFEKQNAMMAMLNRKDSDYEKTELSFQISDVLGIRKISERWGKASIEDNMDTDKIPELNGIRALFVRCFWLIDLKERSSLIMEIMEDKAFKKYLSRG